MDDSELAEAPMVLRDLYQSSPPPDARGYHPPISLSFAESHAWVPYRIFVSFLRDMMLLPLQDRNARPHARDQLVELGRHSLPFAVDRRFPADEVYVCIDRSPLGQCLVRLSKGLSLADGYAPRNACREFYSGVEEAMDHLRDDKKSSRSGVALFNRRIFESVFLLEWID